MAHAVHCEGVFHELYWVFFSSQCSLVAIGPPKCWRLYVHANANEPRATVSSVIRSSGNRNEMILRCLMTTNIPMAYFFSPFYRSDFSQSQKHTYSIILNRSKFIGSENSVCAVYSWFWHFTWKWHEKRGLLRGVKYINLFNGM